MVAALASYPNNLPLSSSSFIGREREIAEARRLLLSTRLLTLTGPGGCGKTRLALAVARDFSAFEHGLWFVDLGGLGDASLVPQVVATSLGVPEGRGRSLDDALSEYLRNKQLLLILDNCEHLTAACAELVQRLLEHCADVRLLATSREPLNVPDEIVWLVPSLSVPDLDSLLPQIAESEAVQLFVARAREGLPDFQMDADNASIIAQICRRIDGIPLAIELAAARVKLLDVAQIAARLDDSLQLLTRGQYTAVPRHQTLRAALAWSYQLLQPRERAVFRRLAVFAGGFTLDDVESVCADDPSSSAPVDDDQLRAADMLDLLANLLDKSLVTIAERTPGAAVRYRLLEPIRQYALEELRRSEDEAALRDRHLAYFTEFAERAEAQLKRLDQLHWLQQLDKEHDNLRAALEWSGRTTSPSTIGLRLATALHLFWQRRTYLGEGRRWLDQAIANFVRRQDDHTPQADHHLARALVALEWLSVYRGDYTTTRAHLERALALARSQDDHTLEALALGLLTVMSEYTGDTPAAAQYGQASLEAARQSGDAWTLALVTHFHGRVLYRRGDVSRARAAFEESERLFRELGDRQAVATVLSTLAGINPDSGAARAQFEEVLAIFQQLGHREGQIIVLSNLASRALMENDLNRAELLYEQALAQARDLSARITIAFCLRGLGRIRILRGDWPAAERFLRESAALNQATDHQTWLALSLAGLARIAAARGQTTAAAQTLGAIEAFWQSASITLDADDQVEWDQHRAAVRAALTHEAFNAAFADGQKLTLEQALQAVSAHDQAQSSAAPSVMPSTPELRVSALGPMRVHHDGRLVANWQFAKVKELLFFLISQPPRTKAELGLALWPGASRAQLRNSLSTTLYHLRRVLGSADWILFDDDTYRFNRARALWFDVDVFEADLVQAARLKDSAPEQAIAHLQTGLQLYQGDFVDDLLEGEWFLLRREELRRKYLDALLQLGQLFAARLDYVQASEAYRRAIQMDMLLEKAHRELMRCYARQGERGQALRQYQLLEQLMHDELSSPPAPESTLLYDRLRRGEEV